MCNIVVTQITNTVILYIIYRFLFRDCTWFIPDVIDIFRLYGVSNYTYKEVHIQVGQTTLRFIDTLHASLTQMRALLILKSNEKIILALKSLIKILLTK